MTKKEKTTNLLEKIIDGSGLYSPEGETDFLVIHSLGEYYTPGIINWLKNQTANFIKIIKETYPEISVKKIDINYVITKYEKIKLDLHLYLNIKGRFLSENFKNTELSTALSGTIKKLLMKKIVAILPVYQNSYESKKTAELYFNKDTIDTYQIGILGCHPGTYYINEYLKKLIQEQLNNLKKIAKNFNATIQDMNILDVNDIHNSQKYKKIILNILWDEDIHISKRSELAEKLLAVLRKNTNKDFIVSHCVSSFPDVGYDK